MVLSATDPVVSETDNYSRLIEILDTLTAIPGAKALEASVTIYPNPNNGIVYISMPENMTNTTVSVYNIIGKEIKKTKITNNAVQTVTLDLYGNSDGIYYLYIKSEKLNYVQKISILNK